MDKLVSIHGREYRLHYGLRSFFVYESITGKPFEAGKTINLYTLEYAMILASNKDVTLEFTEFIDACDEDQSIFITFMELMNDAIKMAQQFSDGKKKVVEKR